MTKFIVKRIGYMLVVLFCVVTITFFLVHSIPGDPLSSMVQDLPVETRDLYLEKYGFDQPIYIQYVKFIKQLAAGDLVLLCVIALLTIFAPLLSSQSPSARNLLERKQWPSAQHWFGTDELGRDLFVRVWSGGRVSIAIGIGGAAIVAVVGCIYGGLAAYFGGKVDMLMMRVVEVLSSVPHLLVVIMMSVVLESSSIPTLLFAMTITGWCPIARLVRSQMLQISRSEYVTAAKIMGVSPLKIVTRHMIPNTISVIIVAVTFRIPGFIFGEAFLSYVGLGVQPPNTSWGALASAAQNSLLYQPYMMFFPALLIALTMLSFTLMGDGLRDALDPKLRR